MKNLTLSVADGLYEDMQAFAKQQDASVNKYVNRILEDAIQQAKRERALEKLKQYQGIYNGEKWSRDELYDRGL